MNPLMLKAELYFIEFFLENCFCSQKQFCLKDGQRFKCLVNGRLTNTFMEIAKKIIKGEIMKWVLECYKVLFSEEEVA